MASETGGQAFPRPGANWTGEDGTPMGCDGRLGMTLRDYFAAKAMQGAFTSPIESTADGKQYIAKHAYAMADAMLKERAK